jgi:hypothetical protein
MDYTNAAKSIIALKNADLKFRDKLIQQGKLGEGYKKEMEDLHNKNAMLLNDIIKEIGYPTIEKVGEEASEAAWLIIQHSIAKPRFMKMCLDLLEKAVFENKASKINLAYLSDRVAVLEGNPQLYGTQFDWDKNGELNPNCVDELRKVNQRRVLIGLNTLEEQIAIIRIQAKKENQTMPKNLEERNNEYEKWRKKTGWIK